MPKMTPTTPIGYVTAVARATLPVGSLMCSSACWAAPSAGVLVVAPHNKPTIVGREMPVSGHSPTASTVPKMTTARPHRLKLVPSWRKAPKKLGPTYSPSVYTNKTKPKVSA